MWIGDFLEVNLRRVYRLHAAVFNRDDVVVKHLAAISLEFSHDFVEPLFVQIADQWQAKSDTAPVLAAEFVMHQDFIAPALHLLFNQRNVDTATRYPESDGLQIGPAFINF